MTPADTRFDLMKTWRGALLTGIASLLTWSVVSDVGRSRAATAWWAVGLAVVLAAVATRAYLRGRRDFAVGLVGGYGILTLLSGGACTVTFSDDLSRIVSGLFGYVLFLIVLLVAVGIVAGLRKRGSP